MMIVSIRTLKALPAYSAGRMKRTQITQSIVDLCLSQMRCEKLVITVLILLIDNHYLDMTYSCNIGLHVNIGQAYSYRSWGRQNSYSGGEVGRAQGNIAGADYGTG